MDFAHSALVPQKLVGFHFFQSAELWVVRARLIVSTAAETGEPADCSGGSRAADGIADFNVASHEVSVASFAGKDTDNLARLDGRQGTVQADRGVVQQRDRAASVDSKRPWRVTYTEFEDFDTKRFGRPEMAQFMHHH